MANTIFEFIEFKYDELTKQINNWLSALYNKSGAVFNSTSPYGQIVNVLKEFFQHNMIYIKQALNIINIEETNNEKAIKFMARISGYNTARPISATGTLKFTIKNIDINEKIKGAGFTLPNKLLMKNKSNGLNYSTDLGSEQLMIPVKPGVVFYIPIIQGLYKTQTFTGNGKPNQSYPLQVSNTAFVENFRYIIKYNGTILAIRDHIYDMQTLEYACCTKTGFNGGMDIYFGTIDYGFIPLEGSIISVEYLVTNGGVGEILTPLPNDWKFMGSIKDLEGNEIALDKLFNITIETNINFASDGDSTQSIKANIPFVSRNFVLATPKQFIFHLNKLNMFSKINAFNKLDDNDFSLSETAVEDSLNKVKNAITNNNSSAIIKSKMDSFLQNYAKMKNNLNDNEIYLYLIPNITKYFNNDVNYFNVPLDAFYLDDDEQNKIVTYLNSTGIIGVTTEIVIVQPVITRYIMNIYIRRFSNTQEDNIRQQIISNVSSYLINNNRFDRIPKSDFINIIKSNVAGIDSVDVYFVSQKNEDYHYNGKKSGYANNIAYNANNILGLDNVHGDIVISKDEYSLIRGGWKDRNGIYYNEDPSNLSGLNSINIMFDGVTIK